MVQYIILLRGINVAGKNLLKMSAFKEALLAAGFLRVSTYIQSGNIVLSSSATKEKSKRSIHKILERDFQIETPLFMRSKTQWQSLFERNPWPDLLEGKRLYVAFVDRKTQPEDALLLAPLASNGDRFFLSGHEIFLDLESAGRTKLTTNNIDKKIGATSTARNLRTIMKLSAMLD